MGEVQNLSKQINFNNLTYYFKGNSDTRTFVGFKDLLGFYENMKNGYTKLEKTD